MVKLLNLIRNRVFPLAVLTGLTTTFCKNFSMTIKYMLRATRIDNELVLFVNNARIFDKTLQGDPVGDIYVATFDFTGNLQGGGIVNQIKIQAWNGAYADPTRRNQPNPYAFQFDVTKETYDDQGALTQTYHLITPIPAIQGSTAPNTSVKTWSFDLVMD
jgi:hypothetical protein